MTHLVMIPGMMCDARLYGPQIEAFADQYAIFIPSIGHFDTIAALAKDILQHAPDSFALLGLSMGGIIAMEILAQAPERVDRVALFDTNPLAEADIIKERRHPQIEAVRQGNLQNVMRNEMKPHYLADGTKKQDILDLCMDMALDQGPEVFINQSNALMTRADQTEILRSVTIPTLILCGREDRLCPLHRHELMHELMPNSQLAIIEDAGHLPVLEQAEKTNAHLQNWLRSETNDMNP